MKFKIFKTLYLFYAKNNLKINHKELMEAFFNATLTSSSGSFYWFTNVSKSFNLLEKIKENGETFYLLNKNEFEKFMVENNFSKDDLNE